MQRSFKTVYTRKWQWGISFLVSAILFLITFFTIDIIFSTNDDVRIMYALAGYNTGSPYPYHPFINYFLGKLISGQYQLVPQVPWYALFHLGSLFISTVIIGKCFMKLAAKKSLPLYIPLTAYVFFYYTVLIVVVVNMQFSTTASVLGAAAVALIYTLDIGEEKHIYIIADILWSMVLLLFCFMTRSFTWYCVICFYGLAVFYQLLKFLPVKWKTNKKWICMLAGSVLIVGAGVFAIRQVSLSLKETVEVNAEFEEYNNYRAEFQDYHKRPDYDSNAEFYERLGWRENTYRAMLSLIFMDEEITTENMKTITDAYESEEDGRGPEDALNTIENLFDSSRIAKTGIAVIVFLFIMSFFLRITDKSLWREKTAAVLGFLGFLIMFFYLGYGGRLPVRTFMVITIVGTEILLLGVLNVLNREKTVFRKVYLSMGLCVCILLSLYNIRAVYLKDDSTKTQTVTTATMEQVREFEEYAIRHQDSVYVYDFSVATVQRDPFTVYPDAKPTNCIISGGSYTFSTLYYQQLELNGLHSLYWKDMLNEDIYFVSANQNYVNLVKDNISETTGKQVVYEEVESFGENGIRIYRFYEENVF